MLSDLSHTPSLYKSTRTDKEITLFQLNERGNLMSYLIHATSHYEKGLTYNMGRYFDVDGNIYIVPFSILGDTMLMIDADERSNGAIPFKRNFPDNYYSRVNVDETRSFKKYVYGDSIRYLGKIYGKDAVKAIFYETAGMKSLEYLLYKPFNMLGLRAQFHIPAVNQVPVGKMSDNVRYRINNDAEGRLQHLIPEIHVQFNADGTITEDANFYAGNRIPDECKIIDWYRDIAYNGNGQIIEDIIDAGGDPSTFNPMLHRGSWMPTLLGVDSKALASAQVMNGHKKIYPLESFKGFFKQLMLIDWTKDANGNYLTDYEHRLGLTEYRARKLVQIYGLVWNSDPVAPIEYLQTSDSDHRAENWWDDFENQYSDPNSDWTRVAFYHLYNHMTGPGGSGQVHLLFPPEHVFEYWSSNDPTNLATSTSETGEWLYPGNPNENLHEMGYFPIEIFNQMLSSRTISVAGQNLIILVSLQTLLAQIWERWHPSS